MPPSPPNTLIDQVFSKPNDCFPHKKGGFIFLGMQNGQNRNLFIFHGGKLDSAVADNMIPKCSQYNSDLLGKGDC